jgi:hypothetical protein
MENSPALKGYVWQARRKFQRVKRIIRHPELECTGRRHLVRLRRRSQSQLRIDPLKGCVRFDARRFDSANATIELTRTLGEKWAAGKAPERHINRGFPINMLLSSNLLEHPEILELALRDEFLLAASERDAELNRKFMSR